VPDFRSILPVPPSFSRAVQAVPGQTVEVPFYGSGWVFLGEADGRPGITFEARRADDAGLVFVFRVGEEGDFALRFFRQDFVRDVIINDHVRVAVDASGPLGPLGPAVPGARVVAERWPTPLQEAEVLRAAALAWPGAPEPPPEPPPAPVIPEVTPDPPIPPPAEPVFAPPPEAEPPPAFASPFDLLPMALSEFEAGRVAEALELLGLFTEFYPSGSDEAWWLFGQFLEANSPSRNVLSALGYYRRLVSEFPQSSRLAAARGRIAFIERFFLNIR